MDHCKVDKSSCSWTLSALYSVSNLLGEHRALESLILDFFVGSTVLTVLFGPFDRKSFSFTLHFQSERKTAKQNTLVSCYGLYTLSVRSAFRVSCISGMENYSKRTGLHFVLFCLFKESFALQVRQFLDLSFRCLCIREAINELYPSSDFDLSIIWCIGVLVLTSEKN